MSVGGLAKVSLWDRVPMKHRQAVILGSVFLVIFIALWALAPSATDKSKTMAAAAPGQLDNLLTPTDPRELGLEAVERRVKTSTSEISDLKARIKQLEEQKRPAAAQPPKDVDEILKRLASLENRALDTPDEGTIGQEPTGSATYASYPSSNAGRAGRAAAPAAPPVPIEMAVVLPPPAPVSKAPEPSKKEEPGIYLPAGSIVSGVLLTGLDAPTGRSANRDPVPAVLRVKHEAILPNHRVASEIRECFVVLAGYGDLSSERAYMRSETLSCVRPDGKVIEAKVEGYVTDETGSAGIRGRYVSKQGSVVAKAALAGLADGASRAFGSNNQGAYGAGGFVSGEQVGTAGLSGGVTTALDRVASYYLQLADQITGVIEVPPGRSVSLVILRGTELKLMVSNVK